MLSCFCSGLRVPVVRGVQLLPASAGREGQRSLLAACLQTLNSSCSSSLLHPAIVPLLLALSLDSIVAVVLQQLTLYSPRSSKRTTADRIVSLTSQFNSWESFIQTNKRNLFPTVLLKLLVQFRDEKPFKLLQTPHLYWLKNKSVCF